MIGGSDQIINTSFPAEIAEHLLRIIRMEWGEMVLENAETGDDIEFLFLGFQTLPRELFVYENARMKQHWDEEGACEANANKMFHIILKDQQVTVVVDDPSVAINQNVFNAALQLSKDLSLGRQEFAA